MQISHSPRVFFLGKKPGKSMHYEYFLSLFSSFHLPFRNSPASKGLPAGSFARWPGIGYFVQTKAHSLARTGRHAFGYPSRTGAGIQWAYWKIPIIYAGFGGVVYAVNFNNTEYQAWRKAYFAKVDGNPNTIDEYPLYSDASLRRAMEYYRRNLELTYIVGVALYLLNILDANVQAHLMDFDVSEDLSMRVEPKMLPINPLAGPIGHAPGIKLSFRF
jgi:hypothetical protein